MSPGVHRLRHAAVKMMMLTSLRGVGGYPRRYTRVAGTRLRSLFPSGRRPSVREESEVERGERGGERRRGIKAGGHMYVVSASEDHERRSIFAGSASMLAASRCGLSRLTPT